MTIRPEKVSQTEEGSPILWFHWIFNKN